MTFRKTVLAYLTGWLIVQPVYNRVYAAWRRREMAKPDGEYRQHLRDQAHEFVQALEGYVPNESAPVALDVIVWQHAEIARLKAAEDAALEADARSVIAEQAGPSDRGFPPRTSDELVDLVLEPLLARYELVPQDYADVRAALDAGR